MSQNSRKSIGNIAALAGGVLGTAPVAPRQYADQRFPYFSDATTEFHALYAQFSADYVKALVQGLNPNDFYEWLELNIRLADIASFGTTQTYPQDDWKVILIPSRVHDYIPAGAKLQTMGSTWLCVNPQNISSPIGNAVVRRCNTTWNHLDFYGNVLKEPIAIDNSIAKAPAPDPQDYNIIARGYYAIQCQKNVYTQQLDVNSRLILGSGAYAITSFTDFMAEFTEEDASTNLLRFTAVYQNPNEEIDDMENRVAGGLEFSWEIQASGPGIIQAGGEAQFSAESRRMGELASNSEEFPITYLWESSDESVATVDGSGIVHGLAPGTCQITAVLEQNTGKRSEPFTIEVTEAEGELAAFTEDAPDSLSAYEQTTVTARLYKAGTASEAIPEWKFTGADKNAYSAVTAGNSATITCFRHSTVPLTVTAVFENAEASAEIALEGI